MEVDRNGLEVLGRDECLALLATAVIGRVGVTSGALPTVLPVNFFFDGERILIRSGPGSKMDSALRDAVVAFEVDDFDPIYHSGWSVVVTGVATVVTDPVELGELDETRITRWAPVGDGRVVAIPTSLVSGRRLAPDRGPG